MLVWLTLPFYDFCGFRSVGGNSVYKRQFLTFIFAVLLPVLSRLLIMSINTTFSIFQDGGRPPSKIFKSSKYQLACYSLLYADVGLLKNVCHTQVLQFFVRAIRYQFVKIVLRTCSPR